MEPDKRPVEGLYDVRRLAFRLGVSESTIRAWKMRERDSDFESPLVPPIGKLNGNVWTEAQVQEMLKRLPSPRKRGRPRKDPS